MKRLLDLVSLPVTQVWTGVEARLVEGEGVTLAVIELAPNTIVPSHRHPNEQVGVLARGWMRFTIGDETREFGPGGSWTIPGDVPHGVQVGPQGAVAIEAFAPRRADWDAFRRTEPREPGWPTE